jgi:hypothetical protein
MFSPSLVSMIFHSFDPPISHPLPVYRTMRDAVDALQRQMSAGSAPEVWPALPIIGRSTRYDIRHANWFQSYIRIDEGQDSLYFWGRVPVDLLIKYLAAYYSLRAGEEYVDLGTALREVGSGSKFDQDCARYLSQTAASASNATTGAAIIDLGEKSNTPPDDYNGRLRHAVGGNCKLSAHAEKVLSVLLERLSTKKGLSLADTTVSCALVLPPPAMIHPGKDCFEQANAVEMLDAVKALHAQVAGDSLPAAINMSLGTHVGPHNGDSPLEEYIAEKLIETDRRFVIAAAGNDGGRGLSGRRLLQPGERDFLTVQSGPRCKDLLVEFWWEEPAGAGAAEEASGEEGGAASGLSIEVSIFEVSQRGDRKLLGVVDIGPGTAGISLTAVPAGLPGHIVAYSLFSAKCRNKFSCIAFAISTSRSALPALHLRFGLDSPTELVVNAWIVVSELLPQSAFVEAGPEGTVMVPASDMAVLSVAGVEASGQVWDGSSRGPAAQYHRVRQPNESSPLMAHLAALSGEFGTSFASPRACADALETLANNSKRPNCHDAVDLMCQTYSLTRANLPDWNPRIGFCKRIS